MPYRFLILFLLTLISVFSQWVVVKGLPSGLIPGGSNLLIGPLCGVIGTAEGFSATVQENPGSPGKVVGSLPGQSQEEAKAAFPKIIRHGRSGAVSFAHGQNVSGEVEDSRRGVPEEFGKEAPAVDLSTLRTLQEVIEQVARKRIIYVGETHDRFSHHGVQLEVIRELHKKNRKIAIGMEMFQRPFQKALDDYLAGQVEEREFLRKTQYFKRWGYDYNLYRPILQFAKSERVPVVALNIAKEIVDKVSGGGLESLSGEEKKSIPAHMDFSDAAYRERLSAIFREHESFRNRPFDFFYQAQILWDEVMAESIDAFLKQAPDPQMIVLAGSGHLTYGSGIPRRAFRRNGHSYAIVLNDVPVEKDIADFLVYPGAVKAESSPRLMVSLREEQGKVVIEGLPGGSVLQKAGLQVGDVILALDHASILSVEDVRIELLFRKKGEKMRVRVLRKDSAWGQKEMEFEVSPQ